MLSTLILSAFLLLQVALADVQFTSPFPGEDVPYTDIQVSWKESGENDAISSFVSYEILLCAGGNDDSSYNQLAALINSNERPKPGTKTFHVPKYIGDGSVKNAFFLKIISTESDGLQIINFSSRFSLPGLTGAFPGKVLQGVKSVQGTLEGPPTEISTGVITNPAFASSAAPTTSSSPSATSTSSSSSTTSSNGPLSTALIAAIAVIAILLIALAVFITIFTIRRRDHRKATSHQILAKGADSSTNPTTKTRGWAHLRPQPSAPVELVSTETKPPLHHQSSFPAPPPPAYNNQHPPMTTNFSRPGTATSGVIGAQIMPNPAEMSSERYRHELHSPISPEELERPFSRTGGWGGMRAASREGSVAGSRPESRAGSKRGEKELFEMSA